MGASLQLSSATLDAEGHAVAATVAWTSSNPTAATVSPNGLVAGLAVGTTTITASAGSVTASVDLTVRDNAPLTAELSGTIRRIDIVLEADRTYTATSDLVLWADRELRVLGTLKADPGVAISLVSDSAITIDAGSVAAGFGGDGGTLGSLFISPTPLEIPDGNFDLFKAKSLTARTGNGGDGGDVAISAPQVNGTALVGIGGLSGEAVVSGGNAAPGGMGGEFEIAMGRDGGFGAGGPSQTDGTPWGDPFPANCGHGSIIKVPAPGPAPGAPEPLNSTGSSARRMVRPPH